MIGSGLGIMSQYEHYERDRMRHLVMQMSGMQNQMYQSCPPQPVAQYRNDPPKPNKLLLLTEGE